MPTCKTCSLPFDGPYRLKFCGAFCQLLYRIEKAGADDCWEWTGAVGGHGYGALKAGPDYYLAHRLSYQLFIGTIPEGLFVCHSCDNRKCINPAHFFVGTNADNAADMAKKGRAAWATRPMTESMRKKMSLAKLGKTGAHTDKQRRASAETMKKLWASPEFRAKMIASSSGRECTEETRAKLRRPRSAESIARMQAASLAREAKKRLAKAQGNEAP